MPNEPQTEMEPQEQVVVAGNDNDVRRESGRRTRRSFVAGGVAAAAGYGLWRVAGSDPVLGRQPRVLRRTFQADATVNRAVFDERGLAPEYPLSKARDLRLNGTVGMDRTLDPASWRLQVVGSSVGKGSPLYVPDVTAWNYRYTGEMQPDAQAFDVKSAPGNTLGNPKDDDGDKSKTGASSQSSQAPAADAGLSIAERFDRMRQSITGKRYQGTAEAGASASSLNIGTPGLLLTMADLLKLPRAEHVFEFHCIEGWSEIVQWGGVRLRDLIEAFPPEKVNGREPRYVYMETPDGNYYGGYDMSAARHPQSLLVTEMSGKPLTQEHGAPLRLFMPVKYGYKNLKRIGLIAYTDIRPDDYWTKLGYDWYAGL